MEAIAKAKFQVNRSAKYVLSMDMIAGEKKVQSYIEIRKILNKFY